MTTTAPEAAPEAKHPSPPAAGPVRRVQSFLHAHRGVRLAGVLSTPLAWMLLVYLLPLVLLFITAFWQIDGFTFVLERSFTLKNFEALFTEPVYYRLLLRTVLIAAAVTILCAVIALPVSFFMGCVASARWQPLLVALILTPLWASYLVKVYAWRGITSPSGGVLESLLGWSPGYGLPAVIITLTYLWLPYMILPVYAALSSMRGSYLDASADLGAKPWRTFRSVVMPTIWPSVVAGSIFTFSLSLGDYITVQLVGGTTQMIGNVVYQNFSVNLPFAAAVATLPVIVMVLYLLAVRRTGALENL